MQAVQYRVFQAFLARATAAAACDYTPQECYLLFAREQQRRRGRRIVDEFPHPILMTNDSFASDVAGPASIEPTAAAEFSWPVRVYYEDTDAGGVVYYANYLRFLERCRSEWMRALGFGQAETARNHGVLFVVASVEIKYVRPARLDDELRVIARIAQRFASYVVFAQEALRGEDLLCTAQVKVACVDQRSMRPTRLPEELARKLAHLDAGAAS